MTNLEIIANYKKANNIDEKVILNTFSEWKRLGYKIKKGEKGLAITIWKYKPKNEIVEVKNSSGETLEKQVETASMFMKVAYFFTQEQVEKIKG